jgi:hypothetical protein
MIAISDQGPGGTIAEVLAEGSRGFSQPMHYAAASPGTLVGVPCIAFGFRGPTMNLTMVPQDGIPMALTLCVGWLARKAAKLMVVATCSTNSSGIMMSRALLLAPHGFSESGTPLTDSVITWLASVEPAVFLSRRQTVSRWEEPGSRMAFAPAIWYCCACPIAASCSTSISAC